MLETDAGYRLALPERPGLEEGRAVVLGLRPEHMARAGEGEGFPLDVNVVEPTGAELQIIGEHGGQEMTSVFRERLRVRPGDRIWLRPDLDHAHVFAADTGRVLRG
jgi:multiple sugar transport system ATP-binding protein